MTIGMEVGVFLAYAFGMFVVYLVGRFLLVPLKWIGCALAGSLAGGAVILIINFVGAPWNIFVPLNIMTAAVIGVLGLPGTLLLLLFFA